MKKAVLVIAAGLMALAMLATPVMAIGPFNALEVGNNKNLEALGSSLVLHRGGEGGGTVYWAWSATGQHWVRWEFQDAASQAKGLMNNAIIATYSYSPPGPLGLPGLATYFMGVLSAGELDNKWIYLSGYGAATDPTQWWNHGMTYWFTWGITYLATYPAAYAAKYAEVYAATPGTPEQKDAAAKAAATVYASAVASAAGQAAGTAMVAEHPQGVFWKHNDIQEP